MVGEATARVVEGGGHLPEGLELGLVALAIAIAVTGILIAWTRLKPEALVPKAQSPQEEGFQRVLEDKYYVDEIYDAAIVTPIVATSRGLLWRGIDMGIIDGLGVNGTGYLSPSRRLGGIAAAIGPARHLRMGVGPRCPGRTRRV